MDLVADYRCDCASGFTGINCECKYIHGMLFSSMFLSTSNN